jgi:hypothetical protein
MSGTADLWMSQGILRISVPQTIVLITVCALFCAVRCRRMFQCRNLGTGPEIRGGLLEKRELMIYLRR